MITFKTSKEIQLAPLNVLRLHPYAKLPVCAHPGEDLAYDIFSLLSYTIPRNCRAAVSTGIAVHLDGRGFILKERSSLAKHGLYIHGGVIDAGYRGEIIVLMEYRGDDPNGFVISRGDKIAQMLPILPQTLFPVCAVDELVKSARGDNGFGSTGR